MMLTRNQLDCVLIAFCDQMGIIYTTMHDEAFCVQGTKGQWLYLWYDDDANCTSAFIRKLEKLVIEEKLKLQKVPKDKINF